MPLIGRIHGRGHRGMAAAVVVLAHAFGAVKVPGEIEQFAANLQRRQGHEIARRLRPDIAHGAEKTNERVLQHIIGLGPAPHAAEVAEHAAGQQGEPIAAVPQEGTRAAASSPPTARGNNCWVNEAWLFDSVIRIGRHEEEGTRGM